MRDKCHVPGAELQIRTFRQRKQTRMRGCYKDQRLCNDKKEKSAKSRERLPGLPVLRSDPWLPGS